MSKWNPFVLLLGMLEKFLYKKADKIISSLPYAYNHINNFVSKEKFIWISNGVDLNNIKYTKKQKTDKFVICYMGAIGVSNNLDLLVDVAKRLKNKEDIYFRIIGSGVEKEKLKNRVNVEKLNNISIESAVSKDKVSGILQLSDVLFLSLIDSPLYRFGISLNKLFDYMAAGRVVLFAGTSKNNPIKDAQVGYIIGSDDIDALERAILEIYFLKQSERDVIGERLRSHVEHKYSIPTLVDKLEVLLKCEISRFEK
jgi:glycosyltransferase involved in cell wall biosynthesis